MINAFKKLNVYVQTLIILAGLALLPITIGIALTILASKKITNRNWRYGTVVSIVLLTIFFGSAWFAAFSGYEPPKPVVSEPAQKELITNKDAVKTPEKPAEKKEVKTTPPSAPTVQASDQPSSPPASQSQTGGVVKMSNSGICHAPGTTYYNRTIHFTAYKTLQACLNAGGRLPKR